MCYGISIYILFIDKRIFFDIEILKLIIIDIFIVEFKNIG